MEINRIAQNDLKLQVFEKSSVRWLNIKDITHFECEGYITKIYLTNNERITVSKLLIRFEEVLTDYGFKRVSRSTLVNISHVSQIILSNNSRYLLINGIKIKISRRRLYLFRNK